MQGPDSDIGVLLFIKFNELSCNHLKTCGVYSIMHHVEQF